ncbi:effector-associated domain 2-containing protein [Microbispora bryophytorum]|uniref:effector-associated domain 2-containing protein n=1 Tax=Microbispora bryophytorum TaxID=1460882 RepID=UPI0033EF82C0
MIGIVTALPEESVAVSRMLGDPVPFPVGGDRNIYVQAGFACGPVVATSLVSMGNSSAANACAHLVRSFPEVRAVLMCGIALGVPRPGDPERDVRLGDIVVGSGGVVHYSHRRVTDAGSTRRGDPLPASPLLLRAVNELRSAALRGTEPWRPRLEELPSSRYRRPPASRECQVFYGRIGSGDELLRSAARRDELAGADDLVAIEMEGAGAALSLALDGRECLVVRGVSDYGDATKSDVWRYAAALAAAAYVRALLEALPGTNSEVPHRSGAAPSPAAVTLQDLVVVMEGVSSLLSPQDRDHVLHLLGSPISGRVSRDSRTRMALLSLAMVCAEYRDGLERLVAVLEGMEGAGSVPVRALAAAVARYRPP